METVYQYNLLKVSKEQIGLAQVQANGRRSKLQMSITIRLHKNNPW